MRVYLTQKQLVRRNRLRRAGASVLAVSALAGVSAAVTWDKARLDVPAAGRPASFVAARGGEEPTERQLTAGNVGAWATARTLYNPKAAPSPAQNPWPTSNDVFADTTYGPATAAHAIQSAQTDPRAAAENVLAQVEAAPSADATTHAASPVVADGPAAEGRVELGVNRTTVITTRTPYTRVSVGQPEVADVTPVGPSTILVTARKAGSTQIIVWDESDKSQTIDVFVSIDLEALRDQIRRTFPTAAVEVEAANGAIVLRGRVPNLQAAEQIAATAAPYSDKVLNFLEVGGGQQVMLQVKFMEMSRKASQELGINLGASLVNDGNFNIEFNGPNAASKAQNTALSTITGSATWDSFTLDYALSALQQNSLARILAEPNVTVISGQEASLLAGGEFPVPVPQSGTGGGSTITIEYREFGVRLNVTPVVLGDGRIRLKVAPEVSDLDFSSPVTIDNNNVPIILKRRVQSTVEMNDGQTFAIAGLMRNNVIATRNATPLLGELPVIGTLFRSVRYQREETELVVLVTPRLVEPMNPGEVPELSGENWRHPNPVEFYLKGDLGSPQRAASRRREYADRVPPRFRGEYGFAAPAAQTTQVDATPDNDR